MNRNYEALGQKWFALLDNPEKDAMAFIPRIIEEGGTREAWCVNTPELETGLYAWPSDQPLRVSVTVRGKKEGRLIPVTVMPLLEGIPQDMTFEEVHPWSNGVTAFVGACRNEGATPLYFHEPFYFRDKEYFSTPGVRQTFLLAGMAYGVRRALLDELTITEGPEFERFAAKWLEEHPGSTRLDVPQLKVDLRGQSVLMPGDMPGDYQLRATIARVEECVLDERKIYMLYIAPLGTDTPNPLHLVIYAPEKICKDGPFKEGDEIDALLWLQGRLLD